MRSLEVRLFGKFTVQHGEQVPAGLEIFKVQEMFCYLLIHRKRPHPRETLAGTLWGDSPTVQSRKYLRQALWQLQAALSCNNEPASDRMLLVSPEWVKVNLEAAFWLDVEEFERAFVLTHGIHEQDLNPETTELLQEALQLYRGDLLEGWYNDWCLFERERLQSMYLSMLYKMMGYCEARHEYELGIHYGARILRCDRASERTHQRLMRLQYLAGDRVAALRQYQRCAKALQEELGVSPSKDTIILHEQIRVDQLSPTPQFASITQRKLNAHVGADVQAATMEAMLAALSDMHRDLRQVQERLAEMHHAIERNREALELALSHPTRPTDDEQCATNGRPAVAPGSAYSNGRNNSPVTG